MATKPLKSLKFPTLDDTYTVPQVDDTLAVQGAAADAKKVGDELTDLKGDISQTNTALTSAYYGASYNYDILSPSSVGNFWFEGNLLKGCWYTFVNNTNNSCTLRVSNDKNTSVMIKSTVNAGASFTFQAEDNYKYFGGWYNGTGTISFSGGIGLSTLPDTVDTVKGLKDEVSYLDKNNFTKSDFSVFRIISGETATEDYSVSTDGDYVEISGSSTEPWSIYFELDITTLASGTYYIMCPTGTTGSNVYGVQFTDANKNPLINWIYINNDTFGTLNIADDLSNVKYLRILLAVTNHTYNLSGYIWMANSSVPYARLNQNGYQPKYRSRIGFNLLNGKTFVSFGDSQTEQNKWQPIVSKALNMVSLVKGYGGYPAAPCDPNNAGFALSSDYILGQLETFLSANYFDIVVIMCGTNDWSYDGVRNPDQSNILIGNDTDTTNATFKGALKKIVKTIITNHPTKQVILMSPIGGQTRMSGENLTEPLTNNNGYTLGTFAKATSDIAEYLGIPFIDVHECGITVFNSSNYLVDGLHINTTSGASKVANKVINGLINNQDFWN